MWAILSGIEGNLAAYEAVIADIKGQRCRIEELYILGDLVGATPESKKLVQRVRNPRPGELEPQVCGGWWEEQCLILHGVGRVGEPTELIAKYGHQTAKLLWDSVDREVIEWLRHLDFGFFELDCLLIHGSSVSVSDELTPETPPLQMLDRLQRMEANTLFCGRSGRVFRYQLESGSVLSEVTTLDFPVQPTEENILPRQVVGVGNVGKQAGKATYTIFDPDNNQINFRNVVYGQKKGF